LQASDIKRLRELEEENRKLKQMYAELSLDHLMLKEVLTKKAVRPAMKRKLIAGLREQFKVSERQACRAMDLRRSVYRYRPQPNRDGEIIKLLLELAHGRSEQVSESRSSDCGGWVTVGITSECIGCIAG